MRQSQKRCHRDLRAAAARIRLSIAPFGIGNLKTAIIDILDRTYGTAKSLTNVQKTITIVKCLSFTAMFFFRRISFHFIYIHAAVWFYVETEKYGLIREDSNDARHFLFVSILFITKEIIYGLSARILTNILKPLLFHWGLRQKI